ACHDELCDLGGGHVLVQLCAREVQRHGYLTVAPQHRAAVLQVRRDDLLAPPVARVAVGPVGHGRGGDGTVQDRGHRAAPTSSPSVVPPSSRIQSAAVMSSMDIGTAMVTCTVAGVSLSSR